MQKVLNSTSTIFKSLYRDEQLVPKGQIQVPHAYFFQVIFQNKAIVAWILCLHRRFCGNQYVFQKCGLIAASLCVKQNLSNQDHKEKILSRWMLEHVISAERRIRLCLASKST